VLSWSVVTDCSGIEPSAGLIYTRTCARYPANVVGRTVASIAGNQRSARYSPSVIFCGAA
jgi:hypothetical protein